MKTEPTIAIEAAGLVKAFGDVKAIDGVDLHVPAGVVYGVLGPNGAGKTTTIHVLSTLLKPDGGQARVFGHDVVREPDAVRQQVSLTGQFASVDEGLSGLENLLLLARLLGFSRSQAKARANELLEVFDLTDAANRLVTKYSGGMRRRIDIAASIIVTPRLLFLDEPTTGLDPHSRNQVWEIVRTLVKEGTTVLLTTQYLDEADQLADRLAVIDQGRVIAEGLPADLKADLGGGVVRVRIRDADGRPAAERVLTKALRASVHLDSDPAGLSARVSDPEIVAYALGELSRSGVEVAEFSLGQPSLDEVFLALTGRSTKEESRVKETVA